MAWVRKLSPSASDCLSNTKLGNSIHCFAISLFNDIWKRFYRPCSFFLSPRFNVAVYTQWWIQTVCSAVEWKAFVIKVNAQRTARHEWRVNSPHHLESFFGDFSSRQWQCRIITARLKCINKTGRVDRASKDKKLPTNCVRSHRNDIFHLISNFKLLFIGLLCSDIRLIFSS